MWHATLLRWTLAHLGPEPLASWGRCGENKNMRLSELQSRAQETGFYCSFQDCRVLGQVRARQLEVDPVLLSSAHSCCARADQWHYVLSATEARRPGRRGFTGNILGNALGQAGRWEAGCSWLSEAQKGQLKPDVVTYSGLFCDWSQSLRLLATMQTCGIRCNVVALTRAVTTLSDRRPGSIALR